MSPRALDWNADCEHFKQQWDDGVPTRAMAAERGVTASTISKQAKMFGLDGRVSRVPNNRKKTDAVEVATSPPPVQKKKKQGHHACRRKDCRRPGIYRAQITTRYIDKEKWSGYFCFKHLMQCLPIEVQAMKKADHLTIRRYSPNE